MENMVLVAFNDHGASRGLDVFYKFGIYYKDKIRR